MAQDGKINRAVLGAAVFGKPEAMKKLSSIVWPVVNSMIAGGIIIVILFFNSPLLFVRDGENDTNNTKKL